MSNTMENLSHLTAAILAGGLGTRLHSVVADRPKVLAEVLGRPFLSYLLDQLASTGVKQIVLCIGYMGEKIQDLFGDAYRDIHLAYSREAIPLGTAGALRLAMPLFTSSPVLVLNGDSFCDVDLLSFVKWHAKRRLEASLLLTKVPDTGRYGRVEVENDGRIQSFHEKDGQCGPGWINAGIYLLSHRLLLAIPEHRPVSLEQEIFPAQIEQGLYGYRHSEAFLDIGTPEAYARAERFFAVYDSSS